MMVIDTPYYEDRSRLSNSNIGWFLNKGPAFLHKMLTEDVPEEKNPVLERGTMIHEYILQPEEFQKDYVVWDKEKPSSAQQEKFCQELANSVEIEPDKASISAYKASYTTKGMSDKACLEKALEIEKRLKDYISFLRCHDNRIMITPYDYMMLEKIEQNISSHKLAWNIIWPLGKYKNIELEGYSSKDVDMTNNHEFHINWEYDFSYRDSMGLAHMGEVKCKSLLDGLTIDFKNKKFIIYDLKTTQKLWHFEDSMEQYDYLRQLAFYTQAVEWYLREEHGIDPKDEAWTYEHYIIAIDTTGSYDIRVFKVAMEDIETRDVTIHDAIADIEWHQRTNQWEHSRAYYEGDGSEELSL